MAATASRITALSRRLTAERGLNGFTIEELCDEVGVSRRTFFNYFPSKEEAVIGIDEGEEAQAVADAFLARGSRGWPAVVDDLIDLAVEHARHAGFGAAAHADFMAAISREPRLLARFVDISREREALLAGLIATREAIAPDDPHVRAVVHVLGAVLHAAGDRILDQPGDDDFATALHDSLAAVRAVLHS